MLVTSQGSTLALPWARAVFHVLAHVEVGGPASCHDPRYVAEAAARFGAAEDRELGSDARALASLLGTHEALARAQALAWVFDTEGDVAAAQSRDLAELADADVRDARALAIARAAGEAPLEVLRAAAELELARVAAWRPSFDEAACADALATVAQACPELARFEVALVPALPRRGRVHTTRIFVGVPGTAGASPHHVAWQAAHEATVASLAATQPLAYAPLERAAILQLRDRARRAGLADSHAAWLASLDLRALGPLPA